VHTGGQGADASACGADEEVPAERERVRRARAGALPDEAVGTMVEAFKVLANPTRVRLLCALTDGEMCVSDFATLTGLSISAVSHQLQALRAAGVVTARVDGKHIYYELRDSFAVRLLAECLTGRQGG
jgi:DNA-binding transcriptional ArsR family regulator